MFWSIDAMPSHPLSVMDMTALLGGRSKQNDPEISVR